MGILLDQAGGGTGSGYAGRDFPADPVDAAREEPGLAAAGLLSQGRRRLHVGLHDLRVHGADGVLPGEHRPGARRGRSGAQATASACRTCAQLRRARRQTRQDLRHREQGNGDASQTLVVIMRSARPHHTPNPACYGLVFLLFRFGCR